MYFHLKNVHHYLHVLVLYSQYYIINHLHHYLVLLLINNILQYYLDLLYIVYIFLHLIIYMHKMYHQNYILILHLQNYLNHHNFHKVINTFFLNHLLTNLYNFIPIKYMHCHYQLN